MGKVHAVGVGGVYTISEHALNHIVDGDFSVRPGRDSITGQPETILTGGLHTLKAWGNFVSKYKGVVSLDSFDEAVDVDWYYARVLQNGTITLKIPKILFSGKAAGATQNPENYYKSGYLWKTLFPEEFSVGDIVDCIDQALGNVDSAISGVPSDTSGECIVIGYAKVDDPNTAIRIQVQMFNREVRSAFPTWTQPWTGNNGKPFSHADTISFVMSESVLRSSPKHITQSRICWQGRLSFESLKMITPEFLLYRTIPKDGEAQDLWLQKRMAILDRLAIKYRKQDVYVLETYLCDHLISKQASSVQKDVYSSPGVEDRISNPLYYNLFQVSQNVYECFYLALKYDIHNGASVFMKCVSRFLAMSVIHTCGLSLLELKRLHKLFLRGVLEHPNADSVLVYLHLLSQSPSRAAMYHEFNMNTYTKQHDDYSMSVVGVSGPKVGLVPAHLYDFVALNLGENYLVSFTAEQRLKIAVRLLDSQFPSKLIVHSLRYFVGSDFTFFAEYLPLLVVAQEGKESIQESDLLRVVKDYHRMLIVYRQRVVMEDIEAYSTDRFDLEFMSPEFCEMTIQQHKRMYIIIMHQGFLKKVAERALEYGMVKASALCNALLKSIDKEAVPQPSCIPDYISSWMSNDKYSSETENFDFSIFER